MKLTSIERKMVVAMVVIVVALTLNIYFIGKKVEEAGGVKSLLVEAGKEIKDINKQIEAAP